jgi:hypothetical protein
MLLAERGRVEFTRDGNAILFSLAMTPLDSIPGRLPHGQGGLRPVALERGEDAAAAEARGRA